MWIEKRKDHYRMYERYTDPITKKKHKVSVKFDKDTTQQRYKARERLDALINSRSEYRYDCTFKTLTEAYLACKEKEVKPSTHRRNEAECKRLRKILGNMYVDNFTAGYVKAKLMTWNPKKEKDFKPKPVTVNEHIQRFKEIIKWGYRNDFVESIEWLDKLEKLKDVSRHQKVKDKYLEKEECELLLKDMPENQKNLTELMIQSGLRIGEALALTVSDFDFENREISVTKTRDAVTNEITTPKTAASIRQVYMQDDLFVLCQHILEVRKNIKHGRKFVFWNKDGSPMMYAAYNKFLREYSEKVLGRRITTHVLRHTHASLLAESLDEKDRSYELIQRRLGHENSKVTKDIYIHVTSGQKEQDNKAIKELSLI